MDWAWKTNLGKGLCASLGWLWDRGCDRPSRIHGIAYLHVNLIQPWRFHYINPGLPQFVHCSSGFLINLPSLKSLIHLTLWVMVNFLNIDLKVICSWNSWKYACVFMEEVSLSGKQVGSKASRQVTWQLTWIQPVCICLNYLHIKGLSNLNTDLLM